MANREPNLNLWQGVFRAAIIPAEIAVQRTPPPILAASPEQPNSMVRAGKMDLTGASDDHCNEVLAEYLLRLDRGEQVDRQAFIAAHPEVAENLREHFRNAAAVEAMVRSGVWEVSDH